MEVNLADYYVNQYGTRMPWLSKAGEKAQKERLAIEAQQMKVRIEALESRLVRYEAFELAVATRLEALESENEVLVAENWRLQNRLARMHEP
jgi:hypothetical protein